MAVSFTIIYYINAYLPHAREFSAYARECITRKISVASGPDSRNSEGRGSHLSTRSLARHQIRVARLHATVSEDTPEWLASASHSIE